MVIAIASVCLVVDRRARSVAVSIGSVGPTVLRCPEAEAGLQGDIDWDAMAVDPQALDRFGASVAAESRPITDHRSTERYRRHAVGVLARRLGGRALEARGAAA
jgi:CO/xanthine dehydrogenase FAD-binding subunit